MLLTVITNELCAIFIAHIAACIEHLSTAYMWFLLGPTLDLIIHAPTQQLTYVYAVSVAVNVVMEILLLSACLDVILQVVRNCDFTGSLQL